MQLLETIISDLSQQHRHDFHVVRLNGFIHTDDKLALKEIWRQLGKEMEVEDDLVNRVSTLSTFLPRPPLMKMVRPTTQTPWRRCSLSCHIRPRSWAQTRVSRRSPSFSSLTSLTCLHRTLDKHSCTTCSTLRNPEKHPSL